MKQHSTYFLNKKRIYLAICLGLAISGYVLFTELKHANLSDSISHVNWSFKSFLFLALALLMMVIRDLAYVIRLRLLTDYKLSWRQSLKIILMWEFASAVSPGVVGGSAVAMFFLNKEKIPIGKSTAVVITTALFDNLFYVLAVPFTVIFVDFSDLIPSSLTPNNVMYFWIGYGILFLVSLILATSLFIYPKLIKHILNLIFKLPYFNRRKERGQKLARDIMVAAKYLKGKQSKFWIKLMASTTLSWTARFLVVNCILMAFVSLSFHNNVIIYARQLVMWLLLLVTPTPGGSGMAEYLFSTFLSDFLPAGGVVILVTILWRIISYYPYLFIGSVILPKWLKK